MKGERGRGKSWKKFKKGRKEKDKGK